MKKLKKVFAVLLTLAMVLGMSMTSFAAPQTGTIKVDGLVSERSVSVSYAQILKLNSTGNEWEFATGVTEDRVGMSVKDIAKEDANLSTLNVKDLTYSTPVTTTTGSVEFTGLEAGVYAIKAIDSDNEYVYSYMIGSVDYKDGTIQGDTLTAKGEKNQPTKTVDTSAGNSVAAGETVGFTITVKYPYFATNSVTKKMEITDNVTNGKIQYDTVKIVGGAGLYPEKTTDEGTDLRISLKADEYDFTKAGETVTITYNVKVDASADLDEDEDGDINITNGVTSIVPGTDGNDVANQTIVKIPTVKAEITKADANTTQAVTGSEATFELFVRDDKNGTEQMVYVDENTNETVKLTSVGTANTNTQTGIASFVGLDADKEYYVKETKAPEGYSVDPKIYKLLGATTTAGTPSEGEDINGVRTVVTTYTATDFDQVRGFGTDNGAMNFFDTSLASLPETGGIGTTIFTIGGCVIMIAAAALFFASRRKSAK